MGKRGPKCTVCSDKALLDATRTRVARGESYGAIASALGLTEIKVRNHVERKHDSQPPPVALEAPPPMPDTVGMGEKERVAAHVIWLDAKLKWAERNSIPTKDQTALSREYMSAVRMSARLNGGADITQLQIVRSQPFKQIMSVIVGALAKHPQALLDVDAVLTALDAEGKL